MKKHLLNACNVCNVLTTRLVKDSLSSWLVESLARPDSKWRATPLEVYNKYHCQPLQLPLSVRTSVGLPFMTFARWRAYRFSEQFFEIHTYIRQSWLRYSSVHQPNQGASESISQREDFIGFIVTRNFLPTLTFLLRAGAALVNAVILRGERMLFKTSSSF